MNPNSLKILVLFYSRYDSALNFARQIARGIENVSGCEVVVRTVPGVSAVCEAVEKDVPNSGAPHAVAEDPKACSGLTLGSPSYFGNMVAAVEYLINGTILQQLGAELVGKPTTVFASTGNLHGGQESTLLTMMLPLLHHGTVISDIPFNGHAPNHTRSSGTPYDASHVVRHDGKTTLVPDEHEIAFVQGK